MKIGIIIIGTGRYINFFDKLYSSIMENFLKNHDKKIYLFTDSEQLFPHNVHVTKVKRQGFPGDTLFRYNHFLRIKEKLILETEVVYYMDIDSLIVNIVDDEILPSLDSPMIAVAHPGFYKISMGTPETRQISNAYIAKHEKRDYYIAGGFQGGYTRDYLYASEIINQLIYDDYHKNIIPVWNDESMWNRYYVSNLINFKVLSPSYVYPESKYKNINTGNYHTLKTENIKPCILALDKDHRWYRSEN